MIIRSLEKEMSLPSKLKTSQQPQVEKFKHLMFFSQVMEKYMGDWLTGLAGHCNLFFFFLPVLHRDAPNIWQPNVFGQILLKINVQLWWEWGWITAHDTINVHWWSSAYFKCQNSKRNTIKETAAGTKRKTTVAVIAALLPCPTCLKRWKHLQGIDVLCKGIALFTKLYTIYSRLILQYLKK